MAIKITIVKNATGETRVYTDDTPGAALGCEYMWTEGNFSCDCNRHIFFERAVGNTPDDDRPCGETAYTVPHIELPDGVFIEIDDVSLNVSEHDCLMCRGIRLENPAKPDCKLCEGKGKFTIRSWVAK